MSASKNKPDTEALQKIERLREENSQLMEDMLVYTGQPGQVYRQQGKMEQLKTLLVRAADALKNGPGAEHSQLVQELRKDAE
jgi:hypothetical protein